jgi:translation initiation factor 1
MSKKKKFSSTTDSLVYSTDPNFKQKEFKGEEPETIGRALQKLKIRLDTRNRAGKAATLVEGFTGNRKDLEDLGKKLKAFCGTGGSVKDGGIIIQGDNREKAFQWLQKNGYSAVKKV